MTYMSYSSYYSSKHGGYRKLASFQMAEIICDFTVEFCRKYIRPGSRTVDQMEQAARSGKQNIAEGSQAAAANPKTEFKLVDVARSSLEELKLDYEDFLRQNRLQLWKKDDSRSAEIRKLAYRSDKSYATYSTYMTNPELAANCALCLINQANYLLDRQLASLKEGLDQKGVSLETHTQRLGRWLAERDARERAIDAMIVEVLKKPKKEE
jgi:four helix bundle protein